MRFLAVTITLLPCHRADVEETAAQGGELSIVEVGLLHHYLKRHFLTSSAIFSLYDTNSKSRARQCTRNEQAATTFILGQGLISRAVGLLTVEK